MNKLTLSEPVELLTGQKIELIKILDGWITTNNKWLVTGIQHKDLSKLSTGLDTLELHILTNDL